MPGQSVQPPASPTAREQAILDALKAVKSNLMHQRRFGADTYGAWRNACARAEGDIEETIRVATGETS